MATGAEIREQFLAYFESHGHRRVRSSSLVPESDPTLLFTNAGMNQFKDIFLGLEQRSYKRAVSSQKCMRVSGKHNDLETVGRTPRHHTFFEMLGNFSFGDYFKKEAIEMAWELCTDVYGLEPERLVVTVFEEDDEAWDLWKDHMGIPEKRLYRCGASENFWSMGDTGPCGPCSELHYDLGDRVGDPDAAFGSDTDRWVEIWNLVFMQFDRDSEATMTPLPSPSIDTGMGLERIASVVQGVASNYETDLFRPIIVEAERLLGVSYGSSEDNDTALRILADHARACMFLIDAGVVPGNEGRGYVLRKIVRRAIRHGKMLGRDDPFLFTLTALVGDEMAGAYPDLAKSRDYAARVVENEERKFSATLEAGLQLLEEVFDRLADESAREAVLPGKELFRLYDTYGFPLDLAREIAAERGYGIDQEGFDAELERQRSRARASWKGGRTEVPPVYRELADELPPTDFTGYRELEGIRGQVLALVREGQRVGQLSEGEEGELVLDRTPFYAEAGGQVADEGRIENDDFQAEVTDVKTPAGGLRTHRVRVLQGEVSAGDNVVSTVEQTRRRRTEANHTATHLVHAALRQVLGPHVKQAGSLVAPNRLRFDFTHFKPVSGRELEEIEDIVNSRIRQNLRVETSVRGLDQAVEAGAMALFGEKYDEQVRVVEVGDFSLELCGGTHVDHTGRIALFKITSETGISAGVRRIEALTSAEALQRFNEDERLLAQLLKQLNAGRDSLVETTARMASELKDASRQIEQLKLQLASEASGDAVSQARNVKDVKVLSQQVENLDRNGLRQLATRMRNDLGSGVVVLGTPVNGRVNLVATVSDDLTSRISASNLIREIAPLVGGGGGGKADLAEAGGKDAGGLDKALQRAYEYVEEQL